METKTKKIIIGSVVILILAMTVFYGIFLVREKEKRNETTKQELSANIARKTEDKIAELRMKLFAGKATEVISQIEGELSDPSGDKFADWKKYRGMRKIYLAFAYSSEGNKVEAMKNLKEVVEDTQYNRDQRALAAQEIAKRLTSFNVEDMKKYLFSDGTLKNLYIAGDLDETEKNLHGLSLNFRSTPLSDYALSDYDYEKAISLKETNPQESASVAKAAAERLKMANNLSTTMKTDEWTYDRFIRPQLYKARIHEKINRFNLDSGDNKVFNNDEIESIYKDILGTENGSSLIYEMILTKLYYAIFLNNVYGYDERKADIDDLMKKVKESVYSKNYSKSFSSFIKREGEYPNDYYKKSEIVDLAQKNSDLRDILGLIGWQK